MKKIIITMVASLLMASSVYGSIHEKSKLCSLLELSTTDAYKTLNDCPTGYLMSWDLDLGPTVKPNPVMSLKFLKTEQARYFIRSCNQDKQITVSSNLQQGVCTKK